MQPLVDHNSPEFYDGGPNSMYVPALARTPLWLAGFAADTAQLIKAMESVGLVKGHRIVIFHAMFGWVAEEFIRQGYGPAADTTTAGRVCSIEQSTWIHANKAANAVVPIYSETIETANGRRNIRLKFGAANARIDWVVSYEVLPDLSDAECKQFQTNSNAMSDGKVVHWVTPLIGGPPAQDARLNLKTISAWKAMMTPDYIVERGTAGVV